MNKMYKCKQLGGLMTLLLLLLLCLPGFSQSGSFGNTFMASGGETTIIDVQHNFLNGGTDVLPGIIGSERTFPQGYFSFAGTASWIGASDNAHVDGYVRTYLTNSFTFPIGDNGKYRPASVSTSSLTSPSDAAYFGASPSIGITSSLKGGNEPILPTGSTFSASAKSSAVGSVDNVEYWDINGNTAARITLTWDANSSVASMTSNSLSMLSILGWDGTQWVLIPSTVDASSLLGGTSSLTSGSITTNTSIVPNTYTVYTLGSVAVTTFPDLVTTVGQPNPSPVAGQTSFIPVTVNNIGTGSSVGQIAAVVQIPSGTTFGTFPSNNNGWVCSTSGTTATCTNANPIASGGNTTFSVPFIPTSSQVGLPLVVPGAVVIGGGEPSSNNGNNTSTPVTTPVVSGAADLVTTVGQPSPSPIAGQTSLIPVTVINLGTGTSVGPVTAVVQIPSGTTFGTFPTNNNGWVCSTSGTTATCTNSNPIASGGSSSLSVPFIPTSSQIGLPLVVPAAVVSGGGESSSNTGNNSSTPLATPAVTGAPDLVTSVGQPSPSPVAGQTSLIPVTVSNIGTGTSSGTVTTVVQIPSGTTFGTFPTNNNGWVCSTSGTTATCTNSNPISSGGNTTFSVPFVSTSSQIGLPLVVPAAVVSGGGEPSSNNGNNSSTPLTTPAVTGTPDLVTSVGQPSPNPVAGQTSFIPVTVSNIGTGTSSGTVTAVVQIPSGTTFGTFPTNNNGWVCSTSGTTATCTNSNPVASGGNTTFSVPFVPTSSQIGLPLVVPAAVVSGGGEPSSNNGNNSSTPVTTPAVTGASDLVLSVGQPSPNPVAGQTSFIPVTVINLGTGSSVGPVTAVVQIPSGTTFGTFPTNNNGWVCSTSGTTATCTNSNPIASGGTSPLSVPFIPTSSQVGQPLVVPAAVVSGGGEPSSNNGNNSSTPVTTPAVSGSVNLVLTKSAPTTATVGTNFNYSLTLSNTGNVPTTGGMIVEDNLPSGIAFLTGSGAGWSCSAISQLVTCTSTTSISSGGSVTITLTVSPTSSGTFVNTATVRGGGDPSTVAKNSNTVSTSIGGTSGMVLAKAFLQGPFNGNTGLMNDDLRTQSLIPLTQPYSALSDFGYSGTESVSSAVFSVTGSNAIVDWVMLELRSSSSPTTIIARRAALIQRDGDIVDTDGTSAVAFNGLASGNYYVAVRHRNHLGVMTANPIAISSVAALVNFTSSGTANYNISSPYAQYTFTSGASSGVRTMWSGNSSADANVIFQGPGSDIDYVFSDVYFSPGNSIGGANFIRTGYLRTDFNLDGNTIYQGPSSDTDIVFFNILFYYLGNSLQVPNAIISQQIP